MTLHPQLPRQAADKFEHDTGFSLATSLIMLARVGSRAHNTATPRPDGGPSDIDWFGIVVPPPERVLGVDVWKNWSYRDDLNDVTIFSLRKFVDLVLDANPNLITMLWLRDQDFLFIDRSWDMLVKQRALFATKGAYKTFEGYATGQLGRMNQYTKEVASEIDQLTGIFEDHVGISVDKVMRGEITRPANCSLSMEKLTELADRLRELRGTFRTNLGARRRDRMVMHGYDTAQAAHVIRLVRMCTEYLGTGQFQVFRTKDADQLRSIKRGELALDDLKVLAEGEFALLKRAYESSTLPEDADRNAADRLLVRIYQDFYRWTVGEQPDRHELETVLFDSSSNLTLVR